MEVTVDGMDAVVEPSGMSSWRVTGMTVLNQLLRTTLSKSEHSTEYKKAPLVLNTAGLYLSSAPLT
ncbi:hypothetical protein [Shewanella sp. CG12_big_fil_rev_8_21_14_0_65_47_15]|uniref:hypothetical protein n=1 Tax=Shewanella sp. CG12_big_fil_rev_8_21_14_0_65_47_15 TaxID=1975537 RepID=UPI000CAEB864|nr:hypothetical protein [Shewanella sp. CG12_big_fil_rev_8_21_14_0_65_47_15]PIW62645.1 MAG: hypothetical protein COW15_02130 [Shewanella sp. CG12_big_fil_rev_8_21_14_0_65_47_15]